MKKLQDTMKELESMLTIINIEGLSSTCTVVHSTEELGDDENGTINGFAEMADNFGKTEVIKRRYI